MRSEYEAVFSVVHVFHDSSLLVRDVAGSYQPAEPAEVLQAALRVLEGQLRGTEMLSSPQAVRDFLRIKLGTLEHEVFAVIHLDAQHRVIEIRRDVPRHGDPDIGLSA